MQPTSMLLHGALLSSALVFGSFNSASAQSLESVLGQLESPNPDVRAASFYLLLEHRKMVTTAHLVRPDSSTQRLLRNRPEDAPRIRLALISLLERENQREQREDDANYHGDLINSVASLRDPQAAVALLGAIRTGGLAREGLVQISSVVTPRLLAMAADDTSFVSRLAAVAVLGEIAERQDETLVSPGTMAAIRTTLLRALGEPEVVSRIAAISSLSAFRRDSLVQRAMATIAREDVGRKVDATGRESFPVRERAAEWLAKHGKP